MLKLGCNSVIFSQLDLYGALQHIAWAGFSGAELCHQQGWGMHVELNTKKSYIDEVKWTAQKHHVELWAIHAGFEGITDEERIKLMTQVFDVASKLSIPVVSIRAFGKANDKEATKQEFKYLREINNRAESRGVRLSVKPHQGASVYNLASALQMVNEIDTPSLGVGFDPLHLTRGGDDPAEVVLKLGKKIAHAQFHDCPTPLTPEQIKKRRGPPSHDSRNSKHRAEPMLIGCKFFKILKISAMKARWTCILSAPPHIPSQGRWGGRQKQGAICTDACRS